MSETACGLAFFLLIPLQTIFRCVRELQSLYMSKTYSFPDNKESKEQGTIRGSQGTECNQMFVRSFLAGIVGCFSASKSIYTQRASDTGVSLHSKQGSPRRAAKALSEGSLLSVAYCCSQNKRMSTLTYLAAAAEHSAENVSSFCY